MKRTPKKDTMNSKITGEEMAVISVAALLFDEPPVVVFSTED